METSFAVPAYTTPFLAAIVETMHECCPELKILGGMQLVPHEEPAWVPCIICIDCSHYHRVRGPELIHRCFEEQHLSDGQHNRRLQSRLLMNSGTIHVAMQLVASDVLPFYPNLEPWDLWDPAQACRDRSGEHILTLALLNNELDLFRYMADYFVDELRFDLLGLTHLGISLSNVLAWKTLVFKVYDSGLVNAREDFYEILARYIKGGRITVAVDLVYLVACHYPISRPPLAVACEHGQYAIVQALLRQGEDPQQGYVWQYTTIAMAYKHASIDCMKLLLDAGARVPTLQDLPWVPFYPGSLPDRVKIIALPAQYGYQIPQHSLAI